MRSFSSTRKHLTAATLLLLLALAIIGCRHAEAPPPQSSQHPPSQTSLELVRVLPIENIREPSGLTIKDHQLFAVSDEEDLTIFRLRLEDKVAVAEPAIQIRVPSETNERLDLEGITTDKSDFLVLAEAARLVLRVTLDGEIVSTQNIDDFAPKGSFATPGAGPEGLALVNGKTIIAAERQPCSLIVLDAKQKSRPIDDDADYPQLPPRPKDATGLWAEGDELWCLTRNGESIVRMDATKPALPILSTYSFHKHAAALAFSDATYGTAEGLAADSEFIYVVFDNNDLTAKDDPTDLRPRIAIFRRP